MSTERPPDNVICNHCLRPKIVVDRQTGWRFPHRATEGGKKWCKGGSRFWTSRPEVMPVHERDCAPCDAAREVVVALAVELDPLDNWPDVEVHGVTTTRHLEGVVARVLHEFPLGGTKSRRSQ